MYTNSVNAAPGPKYDSTSWAVHVKNGLGPGQTTESELEQTSCHAILTAHNSAKDV